jgi:putative SOS response-associated peptidase YedK
MGFLWRGRDAADSGAQHAQPLIQANSPLLEQFPQACSRATFLSVLLSRRRHRSDNRNLCDSAGDGRIGRMCGRFTQRHTWQQIHAHLTGFLEALEGDSWAANLTPRYNVSPGQMLLAVRGTQPSEVVELKWGLIPSWAKDPKIAFQCLNARSETVASKPAFRAAYKSRRCLIPADGYFEWRREGKQKLPYLYEFNGGQLFTFAGLWERWHDVETCTLLTTEANPLAAEVHDRMPVIIQPEDWTAWLQGEQIPLVPTSSEGMTARPVSTYVNNSRHEGPECVASCAADATDE